MAAEPVAVERRALSDQLFDHIRRMVLSGELKGGERIPEEHIADRFGVSRTPIREALRRLEEYGLVRLKPRSYAEVASIPAKDVVKVAQVRGHVEALAASIVAESASPKDLQGLIRLQRRCEEAVHDEDLAALLENDSAFHLELARLSDNKYLYDTMRRLDVTIQLARLGGVTTMQHMRRAIEDHAKLLDAIQAHDVQRAAAILRSHAYRMTEDS